MNDYSATYSHRYVTGVYWVFGVCWVFVETHHMLHMKLHFFESEDSINGRSLDFVTVQGCPDLYLEVNRLSNSFFSDSRLIVGLL